jgi:carotenoid cleavage dioxygenase-like enzyme
VRLGRRRMPAKVTIEKPHRPPEVYHLIDGDSLWVEGDGLAFQGDAALRRRLVETEARRAEEIARHALAVAEHCEEIARYQDAISVVLLHTTDGWAREAVKRILGEEV